MSTIPPDETPGIPEDWEEAPEAGDGAAMDVGAGLGRAYSRQPTPLPCDLRPDEAQLALAELVALRVMGATDNPLALAAAEALRDPLLGRDRRRKVAVRLARLDPDDAADDALEIAPGIASPTGRLWMAMQAIRAFAAGVPDALLTHEARRARRLAFIYFGRALRDSDAGWVDLPRAPDLLTNLVIELLGRTGVPAIDGPEVPGGESGERAADRARRERRDPWAVLRSSPDEPVDMEALAAMADAVTSAPEVGPANQNAANQVAGDQAGSARPVSVQAKDPGAPGDASPVLRPDWTGPRTGPLLEPIAADGPEGKVVRRTWRALEGDLPLLGTRRSRPRPARGREPLADAGRHPAPPDARAAAAVGPGLVPHEADPARRARGHREDAPRPPHRRGGRCAPADDPRGASTDARMLIGTARGWHSAQPCFPLVAMARSGCANPVIYVDELDKGACNSPNGSVASGLLPYLEAETAARWTDECLLAQADVSTVNWIASANDLKAIPSVLLSRFAVSEVPAPPAYAFDGALRQVLADIAADYEVPADGLPELDPELVDALRGGFARGKISLRRLREQAERALGDLLLRRPRN